MSPTPWNNRLNLFADAIPNQRPLWGHILQYFICFTIQHNHCSLKNCQRKPLVCKRLGAAINPFKITGSYQYQRERCSTVCFGTCPEGWATDLSSIGSQCHWFICHGRLPQMRWLGVRFVSHPGSYCRLHPWNEYRRRVTDPNPGLGIASDPWVTQHFYVVLRVVLGHSAAVALLIVEKKAPNRWACLLFEVESLR